MTLPTTPVPPLVVQRNGDKIYSHLRKIHLVETPEERVRQEYVCILVNEYGYALNQMGEELSMTGRGSANARADIVIWRTAQDKTDNKQPLIIVECKSNNVTISEKDYAQGESYARIVDAPFFVTHNNRETRFWRVLKDKMPGYVQEITDIPHATDSDKAIKELLGKLKTFREDEFADLLHKCHNVIRNREHKDPAAAFDEIAKILFVKVYVERELKRKKLRENRFTQKVLEQQIADDPINALFKQTREYYRNDRLFEDEASRTINLKPATSFEIVGLLEVYNLSDTSEDVKGIAFERFLGRTFRGEIGQFFTPRPIVEFMVHMVQPQEGDVICDPASGSGGFLIRAFELLREQITSAVDAEYQAFEATVNARTDWNETQKAEALRQKDKERQTALDQTIRGSRLWHLANRCLYGTDANDRMARTSKMNMIMHGDGHGGVHHHNGFLNVNGIFEGRFDIILTNPPFGANVEASDVVRDADVTIDYDSRRRYEQDYGDLYREAQARLEAAKGQPIASLFDLGYGEKGRPAVPVPTTDPDKPKRKRDEVGKVKTEILFIERCLSLLKPGGRLGIVLPEGIFNNPSLAYVREYCEDRAYIRAVVSLPQETFYSSGASVKASLLFLQKFTDTEKADFDLTANKARSAVESRYEDDIRLNVQRLEADIQATKEAKDIVGVTKARAALRDYLRTMQEKIDRESRAELKAAWSYPIFLYEAEKVGITATGEADANELYPNTRVPAEVTQTCLELYRQFRANPSAFLPSEEEA